jgi:hypothetical protein
MNDYYEMYIRCTGSDDDDVYSCFNEEELTFETLLDAVAYLDREYAHADRLPMYSDRGEGSEQCGYVYSFKNSDVSHASKEWYQVDWVTIYHIKDMQNVFLNGELKGE